MNTLMYFKLGVVVVFAPGFRLDSARAAAARAARAFWVIARGGGRVLASGLFHGSVGPVWTAQQQPW